MRKILQKKFSDVNVGEVFEYDGRRLKRVPRHTKGALWWKKDFNCIDVDTLEDILFTLAYVLLDMLTVEDGNWAYQYEDMPEETVHLAETVDELAERASSDKQPEVTFSADVATPEPAVETTRIAPEPVAVSAPSPYSDGGSSSYDSGGGDSGGGCD